MVVPRGRLDLGRRSRGDVPEAPVLGAVVRVLRDVLVREVRAEEEEQGEVTPISRSGTASGPAGESGKQVMRLCRLTQHRNKAGDITSSLAWDDLTGMQLDAGKVVEARSKEVTYLRDKRVYDRVLRQHAVRNKWKIIRTRWIDINKGDDVAPNYRSRCVAKEIAFDKQEGLFAAPPPLEVMKLILSTLATANKGERLMVADVKRAFFHAKAKKLTYVKLPAEDVGPGEENMCGRLNYSMYGTRRAAINWQAHYTKVLV